MENDLAYTLLQLWVLWYSSAAAFGSFIGTSAALGLFFGIRSWRNKRKSRRM